MPRRSTRPRLLPDDAELEAGWIRHDGGEIPVSLTDMPALLLRNGTRIRAGYQTAEHWDLFDGGSCWRWFGNRAQSGDIIAWRPEDA